MEVLRRSDVPRLVENYKLIGFGAGEIGEKTQRFLDYATQHLRNIAHRGGSIMFVGTKRQIRDIVKDEAVACKMPYVTERWLGGMLTNIQTIRQSISRLEDIEELERSGTMERLPKKEQSMWNVFLV